MRFINVKKKCPTCDKLFIPKSERNQYCSRKCFKKNYYHRKKAEEISSRRNPEFTCPSCGQHIILSFDPVKDNFKWLNYKCPGCFVFMINVSEDIVTIDEPIS